MQHGTELVYVQPLMSSVAGFNVTDLVDSGCCREADPVSSRDPPEADQQPARWAGHQGEADHRAAGVSFFTASHQCSCVPAMVLVHVLTCVQPQPGDHAGAREATGGAREAEDRGAGEEPPAAGTHVTLTHSPVCVCACPQTRAWDLNLSAGCS